MKYAFYPLIEMLFLTGLLTLHPKLSSRFKILWEKGRNPEERKAGGLDFYLNIKFPSLQKLKISGPVTPRLPASGLDPA